MGIRRGRTPQALATQAAKIEDVALDPVGAAHD